MTPITAKTTHPTRTPPYHFPMRGLLVVALLGAIVGCSNDVDPRLIPGGGVGDGEIDGEVNIYVIDEDTEAPIAGATVAIGETEKKTDAKGLVVFADVEGKQTITVLADGYRSSVWVGVNGANCTIGMKQLTGGPPEQATLSGTIAGWTDINPAQGHYKLAAVVYSQTDELGAPENDIKTPGDPAPNVCFLPNQCNWTVNTRTGTITLIAIILDVDSKGTLERTDDTSTVSGYAFKSGIVVANAVNQSGIVLDQIEAGNLEMVDMDIGTPPAGLPETLLLPGVEIGEDEVLQLPLFVFSDATSVLVPKPTAFVADGSYRLSAIAGTTSGEDGAQSAVVRQGLTGPTLAAGTWLVPPVNVMATRTTASFSLVEGAKTHNVTWENEMGEELLQISLFDPKIDEVEVPNLVALPTSGTLTAKVNAIGADIDLNDFSLEEDSDKLWGFAAQPVDIP